MGFGRGQKSEKKKPEQWPAGDDVRQLAEEIIGESHPHLADAEILYLMRYPSWKAKGKTVGGVTCLATPQHKALTGNKGLAFIITINSEEWDRLPAPQQRALLDHELCHCEYDSTKDEEEGDSPWKLVGHDVEEFGDVIERHGLWHDDLRLFADEVGRQLELGLGAAPPRKRAGAVMRPAAAAKRSGEVSSVTITSGKRSVTLTGDHPFERIERRIEEMDRQHFEETVLPATEEAVPPGEPVN